MFLTAEVIGAFAPSLSPPTHLASIHHAIYRLNAIPINILVPVFTEMDPKICISSFCQSCPTLCNPMDCSSPGFPVHHQLLELAQTHVHQVSDAIQPSHPLLSLLPSIFPSIRVLSSESVLCIRWPKYCSFSFSISPSNEYSVLISFRMDWFDLLAVQGTLKSLLHHHNSKVSVLQHSAFFIVQLSHPQHPGGSDGESVCLQ